MIRKIKAFVIKTIRFVTRDIWRINKNDVGKNKFGLVRLLKSFILAIRNISGMEISTRAGALTYKTVLSIVPLLAVIFGISRGFGLQSVVEDELHKYFSAQEGFLEKALSFVNSSLEYAQGGVFLGIGFILLIYTVIMLFSDIEDNFNYIWNIKKARSYYRKFTDYFALFFILLILIIVNSVFSIFINLSSDIHILNVLMTPTMKLIPLLVTAFIFSFIYIYIPNTKVHIGSAIFGAIVAAIAFQGFQYMYINGQIWISKYNAIYGSFAAIPLFLLWVQMSWFIVLFGVELAYAHQNSNKFDFERETNSISKRYKNFVSLLITSLIVQKFENGETPYTANDLSIRFEIPMRLTTDIIYELQEAKIITETNVDPDGQEFAYIPAVDINKISIDYLFEKLDIVGSEDFNIDIKSKFGREWDVILNLYNPKNKEILVKDLR